MNILIIYAHPNPASYNAQLLHTVQQSVNSSHQVKVIDLYAEKFNPILRFDAQHKRRDLAQDPETKSYRDLLMWADQFIFIFPIWWSGMPAILKGFTDRVFVAGFAYHYTKLGLSGHLKGCAWIITTHNTPRFILPFAQDYTKVLKRQILKPCGIKSVKVNQITQVEQMSDKKRKQALKKISKIASRL